MFTFSAVIGGERSVHLISLFSLFSEAVRSHDVHLQKLDSIHIDIDIALLWATTNMRLEEEGEWKDDVEVKGAELALILPKSHDRCRSEV